MNRLKNVLPVTAAKAPRHSWVGVAAAVLLAHSAALAGLLWAHVPRVAQPDQVVQPVQLLMVNAVQAPAAAPRVAAAPPTQSRSVPKAVAARQQVATQAARALPAPPIETSHADKAATPPSADSPQEVGAPPAPQQAAAPAAVGAADTLPAAHAASSAASAAPEIVAPSSRAAYLRNPAPVYPADSRRLGEQGTVVVRVLINAQGQPQQVDIKRSSGHTRLDQTAREAVMRWRFVAGQRNGIAEAMWHDVPLKFSLT